MNATAKEMIAETWLMPQGVVGSTAEIVERHVEVIGKSDEDGCGWDDLAVFVSLVRLLGYTDSFRDLLLREASFRSDFLKLGGKTRHKITSFFVDEILTQHK